MQLHSRSTRRYLRTLTSLAVGGVVGLIVSGSGGGVALGLAAGWTAGVLLFCLSVWTQLWRLDEEGTAAHARAEDPGRGPADVILLVAAAASVAGVGYILVAGSSHDLPSAGLGVAVVIASWLLVHTIYGVRYADLYFSSPKPPIDFGDERPRYSDFAYVTFCLGMTYQISDTNLKTRQLRTTVLWHTLLSYFLGAVVLACTINLVSGLAG